MKNLLLLPFLLFIVVGCTQSSGTEESDEQTPITTYETPAHHTDALTQLFDAHGGYENWSEMKSLSYAKGGETTVTNLVNRKILVSDSNRTIGYDGEEVWVTPDTVDASKARFYHNLFFYFYAMPFVVGDAGANYEQVDTRKLMGKSYNGIKISYDDGVGDASDDNYIIWTDQETNKMEWLMYTVTYGKDTPNEKYKLIKYDGWDSVENLLLPTRIQWHAYDSSGTVGDMQGEVVFEDIEMSEIAPADSLFTKPENVQIAPL